MLDFEKLDKLYFCTFVEGKPNRFLLHSIGNGITPDYENPLTISHAIEESKLQGLRFETNGNKDCHVICKQLNDSVGQNSRLEDFIAINTGIPFVITDNLTDYDKFMMSEANVILGFCEKNPYASKDDRFLTEQIETSVKTDSSEAYKETLFTLLR